MLSMMKVLIIDHYDSFSYNLQQYCQYVGAEVEVMKCDDECLRSPEPGARNPDSGFRIPDYSHIILSPGPGSVYNQGDIGHSANILQQFMGKIPILGVCLGHQLMAHLSGAKIIKTEPFHGKKVDIAIVSHQGLFVGLPEQIQGMRYHSQAIDPSDAKVLQESGWEITAQSLSDNKIMAIEHQQKKAYGLQFHPESIGTKVGMEILGNFLKI